MKWPSRKPRTQAQGPWTTLNTKEEFLRAKGAVPGWIVNVDKPTRTNKLHLSRCQYPRLEDFQVKVLRNRCETGYYLFTADRGALANPPVALEDCGQCQPRG